MKNINDSFVVTFDDRMNALVSVDGEYIELIFRGALIRTSGNKIVYRGEDRNGTLKRRSRFGNKFREIIITFGNDEDHDATISLEVLYSDREMEA